jgi:hypothetical protein
MDFLAKPTSKNVYRKSLNKLFLKGHAESAEQEGALRIGFCSRDNCYIQAFDLIYLIVIDLGKDNFLLHTHREVSTTIETFG